MIRLIETLEDKEINKGTRISDSRINSKDNNTENNINKELNEIIGSCGKLCSQCKIKNCDNS